MVPFLKYCQICLTLVPFSTQKFLGITTLSRPEHSTAQTRELACTKVVLPEIIGLGLKIILCVQLEHAFSYLQKFSGLSVTEVAHDIQQSVSSYIKNKLKLTNSYDTWHGEYLLSVLITVRNSVCVTGTRNGGKQLFKITKGRVKDSGIKWFPQLTDKVSQFGQCNSMHKIFNALPVCVI